MNVLEMTDLEIYKAAIAELRTQLGTAYTARFLRQCKPNEYDYSVERHKWLDDEPDIGTIVARIRQREAEQKKEERIKAKRVAAWRKGLLELTDIEIYEVGLKILIDKFDAYGYVRFFQHHFKLLSDTQPTEQPPTSDSSPNVRHPEPGPATEVQD